MALIGLLDNDELSAGCSLMRAEGFFCRLDVLYGGQGINKLQFLIESGSTTLDFLKLTMRISENERFRQQRSADLETWVVCLRKL